MALIGFNYSSITFMVFPDSLSSNFSPTHAITSNPVSKANLVLFATISLDSP